MGLPTLTLPARVGSMTATASERLERPSDPCLAPGRWLERSLPPATGILHDQYTFVPRALDRAWPTWALTEGEIERHQPAVIVTNGIIRDRFGPAVRPEDARQGADAFLASRRAYERLDSHELPYHLVASFPDCHATRVYARDR